MSKEEATFYQRLTKAQVELNAPKGQFNKFGNFHFRSAEDILEGVKPVNLKHGLHLQVTDVIEVIGERYYVKAIAIITDVFNEDNVIEVTAYARESLKKKGMDEAMITGSASSYARKYALNGMYLIDDNKDPDTNEFKEQENHAIAEGKKKINNTQVESVSKLIDTIAQLAGQNPAEATKKMLHHQKLPKELKDLSNDQYGAFLLYLKDMKETYTKLAKEKEAEEETIEQNSLLKGNTTTPNGSES